MDLLALSLKSLGRGLCGRRERTLGHIPERGRQSQQLGRCGQQEPAAVGDSGSVGAEWSHHVLEGRRCELADSACRDKRGLAAWAVVMVMRLHGRHLSCDSQLGSYYMVQMAI